MYLKFSKTYVILCLPFLLQEEKQAGITAEEVAPADDLEFWVRDPKFNLRRNAKKPRPTPAHLTPAPANGTTPMFRVNLRASNNKPGKAPPIAATMLKNAKAASTSKPAATTKKMVQTIPSKSGLRQGPSIYRAPAKKIGFNQQIVPRGSTLSMDEEKPNFVDLSDSRNNNNQWWRLANAENKSELILKLSPYSIMQQMIQVTTDMPEANITTEVLGRTAEYNDLVLLKVTETKSDIKKFFRADDDKYIDEVPEKKIIFIVHGLSVLGIDAMEAFNSQEKLQKLLSYYFSHLDKFDIFLMPMANPDGYAYIMNRMGQSHWNKNLSPQSDCAGVALDRNFDVAWNSSMSSMSSCSQHYPGPSSFSEPESRAVRDVMHRFSHKMVAYLHVHPGTYSHSTFKGDAVLYPKGYSDSQSDDDKYIDLKGEIDECMKNASFRHTSVSVETLHSWYGQVFGTSVDYASTVYGIPFAMELVMQVYPQKTDPSDDDLQNIALEEIWSRVIDVIFKAIHKNIHANEVKK